MSKFTCAILFGQQDEATRFRDEVFKAQELTTGRLFENIVKLETELTLRPMAVQG